MDAQITESEAWRLYRSDPYTHTATLLAFYVDLVEDWTKRAARRHKQLTYDECRTEVISGMVECFARFDPAIGSFATFAAFRATNKVKDYARAVDPLTRDQRKAGQINLLSVDGNDTKTVDADFNGLADEEIWPKIYQVVRTRPPLWFILNAIYRDGWLQSEVAKFLGVTPSMISLHVTKALNLLRSSRAIRRFMAGRSGGNANHKPDHLLSRRRRGLCFVFPKKGYTCCAIGCTQPVYFQGRCRQHSRRRCAVEGCGKAVYARRWCESHYQKHRYQLKTGKQI